jgi:HEAT repeat protein
MRSRYRDLFTALLDPDPSRADAAYDAVLFDRGDALDDLVELYRDSSEQPSLRFYAVQLMGFSDSKPAVPFVEKALEDGDPSVRAEACRALEDLRSRRSVDKLKTCLDDEDVRVRRAAREAVRMLGGKRGRST